MNTSSTKIKEKHLQIALKNYLSDPSRIYELTDGRTFQILSMGRLNVHEGPDYLDMAILINGKVVIGNAEFHSKSSEWLHHNHHNDNRYRSVILHIVFDNDIELNEKFGTLVVDQSVIRKFIENSNNNSNQPVDMLSTEELQNYALIRLLRFTSEAQKIVNKTDLPTTLQLMARNFLNRYLEKRNRHIYDVEKIEQIISKLPQSPFMNLIEKMTTNQNFSIADEMVKLSKTKIADEGTAMRREIILNVVLPVALTQANEEKRIGLLVWYWTTRSAHKYGLLTRKFPDLPQNFIWQQQGMLEYLREIEHRNLNISEAINFYSIGGVLSFLKWGNLSD